MRGPLHLYRLRRKWRQAQRAHAAEHEAGVEVTMSCEAVGHWWVVSDTGKITMDSYEDFFDADMERQFVREYRPFPS